jgi:muramoyltetrapeptide carboxypeptidase
MATHSPTPILKPDALLPGDTIAVIAPASQIKRDALLAGVRALNELGYQTVCSEEVLSEDRYFAGSVKRRVGELHQAFSDRAIKAIFCARGGYGTNYLLPHLDLKLIRNNPKIFLGYSDVTTLHTYLNDRLGLVTFHGPMVTKDFATANGVEKTSLDAAISGKTSWRISQTPGLLALQQGRAEGKLYGGCLSMLAASLGTPYEIKTQDTILFLEDIATKPYQIDRMLMQLKYAGKLDKVRGVVFGEMIDCVQAPEQPYTLEEVIMRVLADFDFPVAFGLRSGHVSTGNITLPIGVKTQLRVSDNNVELEVRESATVSRTDRTQAVSS